MPTKVHLVKATVFLVVLYGCKSWTIKKTEHWRIDAFELWGWRRLLRVLWTSRRSNQSILKEISPEYSWEGLMLKLKLPILWPPDAKNWLTGKDPDTGKEWRQEKWMTEDGWMASPTQWTWVWASSGSWWWTGKPGVLQSMGLQRVRHDWETEVNWTELNNVWIPISLHSPWHCILKIFKCHYNKGEQSYINLYFSEYYRVHTSFQMFNHHLHFSFCELLDQIFCPFFYCIDLIF